MCVCVYACVLTTCLTCQSLAYNSILQLSVLFNNFLGARQEQQEQNFQDAATNSKCKQNNNFLAAALSAGCRGCRGAASDETTPTSALLPRTTTSHTCGRTRSRTRTQIQTGDPNAKCFELSLTFRLFNYKLYVGISLFMLAVSL